MKKILSKLMILLDKKQKHQMLGLIVLMIIGAAFETASIALVLSVVTMVMSSDAIETNKYVAYVYHAMKFSSYKSFTVTVMILLIVAFIVKNVYLYLEWKAMYAFIYRNQFRTSERMMRSYLRKDYEFYLFADTAVVQRSITSDVNNMYALILALLTLISEIIVFVALVAVLLIVDPLMCMIIAGLMLVVLLIVKAVLKPIMRKAGEQNQECYSGLFKWISQTVLGIKEVKINGKEQYFVDQYNECGKGYVAAVQKYSLYDKIPKLLIETVCISAMVLYMLILVISGQDLTDKIPAFSAFAVAAIKLMPSVNKINNQFNSISFLEPFFMNVSDTLQEDINNQNTDMAFANSQTNKLVVGKEIELKGITYKYPQTEKYIFEDASMTIPIGSAVGVVGPSGAGKTTIIDILLGLLQVERGDILADGMNIQDNYRGWLKNIGYIPQMIYMLDDTIRANVAFGISKDELDEKRVWEVLEDAHLADFIKTLPDGLDTQIGERGIRLSGGQRQRIGIARALYNDPEVLVLDEATSALDNDTEAAIMESINSFHGKKTLVIIAHRLQTIEKCDVIYRVSEGKIVKEAKKN